MNKNKAISVLVILGGLAISVVFIYPAIKEMQRGRQIEKEVEALRQEAEKIKSNNDILQEKIGYFDTQDYKERVAKEKLNLQKDGEQVVVVKQSPSKKNEIHNEEYDDEELYESEDISSYQKWWNYFFQY